MGALVLVGGGGLAREVLGYLEALGRADDLRGVVDDRPNPLILGASLPWLGTTGLFEPGLGDGIIVAIGDPASRERVVRTLAERSASFTSVIHPTAVVGPRVTLGQGVILAPFVVVTADVLVGDHVLMNVATTVGHDARIGSFSTLSGHCDVTGGAQLGNRVFLGSGVSVIPQCTIGDDAYVGAGSVVMSSVPTGARVFGVPARVMPR